MRLAYFALFLTLFVWACRPAESPKKPAYSERGSSQAKREMPKSKSTPDSFQDIGIVGLEKKLNQVCQRILSSGEVQSVAIHFLDLHSDSSIIINGQEKFVPASLLKMSIMVALFKLEENRGNVLNQSIKHNYRYESISDTALPENKRYKIKESDSLKVLELITIMLQFSDNNATLNLLHYLDLHAPGLLNQVEKDLNADIPENKDMLDDLVQVDHFSFLLRSLYKEDYLDMLHSHQALDLLRQSKYDLGMRKGIPLTIPIAHKYGVRFNTSEKNPLNPVQLHEVGLVFHPTRPFILAIMTKGKEIGSLRQALEKVANSTYTYMESYSLNELLEKR